MEKKFLLVDGDKARVLTVQLPGAVPSPSNEPPSEIAVAPGSGGGVPLGAWVLGRVSLVALGGFAYFWSRRRTISARCAAPARLTAPTRTPPVAAPTPFSRTCRSAWGRGRRRRHRVGDLRTRRRRERDAYAPVIDVRPMAGGAYGTIALTY